MDIPKVSVIVPNYNHEQFLRKRIDTILGQTFQDFELILLDDCSTDNSRSVLQSYQGHRAVRIEFNEINSGSTFKQWNKGVGMARGRYIWIAESDDYADTQFLDRLVSALDDNEEAAFTYSRSYRVSRDEELDGFADAYLRSLSPSHWSTDFNVDGRDECAQYLSCQNTIPNASAVLLRKAIYEMVGGADESMRLCGDWKLWAELAMRGRIVYFREPLNYYRFHRETVRTKLEHSGLEAVEALHVAKWVKDRVCMSPEFLRQQKRVLRPRWIDAVLDRKVPAMRRLAIFRAAWGMDSSAPLRILRALPSKIRRIGR